MRLWLGAAFAGVALITAASVYVFVDDSTGRTLQSESADLAVGKTSSLADRLAKLDKPQAGAELVAVNSETFDVGRKPTRQPVRGRPGSRRPGDGRAAGDAVRVALDGRRYRVALPGNLTVAAAPIFGSTCAGR